MDWTRETQDPLNEQVRQKTLSYLNKIRTPLPPSPSETGLDDYDAMIKKLAAGKRVLDIGICEHTSERIQSSKWKHRLLVDSASYVLGIDIIESLIKDLDSLGFNVRVCDATSEMSLGERFDLVHIGDVIEHVENPVKMLRFAKRHLAEGGRILVRTPNPYCYDYVWGVFRHGTDRSNLEHMFYVLPTHALEMARRSGLQLVRYYTLRRSGRNLVKSVAKFLRWGFLPDELYSTIFVYEFTAPEQGKES